ncbi:MAG: hypothetical protein GY937_12720 [bacterium]|nr:hypothetical protein [bacterium]
MADLEFLRDEFDFTHHRLPRPVENAVYGWDDLRSWQAAQAASIELGFRFGVLGEVNDIVRATVYNFAEHQPAPVSIGTRGADGREALAFALAARIADEARDSERILPNHSRALFACLLHMDRCLFENPDLAALARLSPDQATALVAHVSAGVESDLASDLIDKFDDDAEAPPSPFSGLLDFADFSIRLSRMMQDLLQDWPELENSIWAYFGFLYLPQSSAGEALERVIDLDYLHKDEVQAKRNVVLAARVKAMRQRASAGEILLGPSIQDSGTTS